MKPTGNVTEHYDRVLSDVYAWMQGGFDAALARNAAFFERHAIEPAGSRIAIDLGAGCGFQSIPLADLGYSVVAIDTDRKLLAELAGHAGDRPIAVVRDDLLNFEAHLDGQAELFVCMTDTLLHLPAPADVEALFAKVAARLEPGGRLVLTYRDLSAELLELDRFIPVRSDPELVLTCFLEYEPATVKVHDLVYRCADGRWQLHKSFYRKLRLAKPWVDAALGRAGLDLVTSEIEGGTVTTIAARR